VCVRGDEDYSFGELAIDVGSGLAVAACEKDEKCSEMMGTITFVSFVIALMIFCTCPPEPEPFNRRKTAKRVGAAGSGYLIGKFVL
jgi:hypothetical protein